MPVLGICNGLQVRNTVMGGTLIQHIPDSIKCNINHEQPAPKNVPSHSIIIEENSLLAKLSDKLEVMVNSIHHQAIDNIGKGLTVSARATDGLLIEAMESNACVQWHCEYINSELDRNLFKRLIEASLPVV